MYLKKSAKITSHQKTNTTTTTTTTKKQLSDKLNMCSHEQPLNLKSYTNRKKTCCQHTLLARAGCRVQKQK